MSSLWLSPITALHLLAVDLAAAGPLFCMWLRWRESSRGDAFAGVIGRRLAGWCVAAMAAGAVLGLGLLAYHYAARDAWWSAFLAVPRSRVWFGLAELGFSLACLIAYTACWRRLRQPWHHLLGLAAATNLLYHFPPFFAAVRTTAAAAEPIAAWSSAAWKSRLFSAEIWAKAAHVWASSAVVAGVFLAALTARVRAQRQRANRDSVVGSPVDEDGERASASNLVVAGARLSLLFVLLQVPSGLWLVWVTDAASRDRLLFGDTAAGLFFATGILAVLGLFHVLAALALGDGQPATIKRAVLLLVVVILLMVLASDRAKAENVRKQATPVEADAAVNSAPAWAACKGELDWHMRRHAAPPMLFPDEAPRQIYDTA